MFQVGHFFTSPMRPRAAVGATSARRTGLALTCAFCVLSIGAIGARAEESPLMPDNIIFVTSTGYWEESADPLEATDKNTAAPTDTAGQAAPVQRGYYKLVAVRQPEGNTHIFLQQIATGDAGPTVVSSAELDEFSGMKAYVTDIRPETSDGVARQPGLFATVYLKTDPKALEPETWTVLIDDIGDIKVERETN